MDPWQRTQILTLPTPHSLTHIPSEDFCHVARALLCPNRELTLAEKQNLLNGIGQAEG